MSIPTGVEIKVTGKPRLAARDRLGAVFGPIFSRKRYILHNTSMANTLRGILERVFLVKKQGLFSPPVTPEPGHIYLSLLPEWQWLTSGPKFSPLNIKDTVSLWKGAKKKVYQRALDSLLVTSLTREDGFLKTFVKCEKIDSSKEDPAPRVIQPRSPRYNLHLASYLKPYEHEYYARVDRMFDTDGLGDRTIFKGLNAKTAAEHLILKASRYSNPVFIGLDASRFDQHVSEQALRWEHSIYLECVAYGHNMLSKLLEWQVDNVGRAYLPDGTIKYRVRGRRMSGDMNTSLGNCILMSSMVHAYLREKKVPKFSLANNGDDCVVIMERNQLKRIGDLSAWFERMGFDMKIDEPVYDIRQVSFCQVHVLTSPGYNICVRNPEVALSKDLHSAYPFTHDHQFLEWLSASGECGLHSHFGVPVLEQFYRSFPVVAITDANIERELETWRKYAIVGGAEERDISDEMRHSFWVAFGITPDCQIALEEELKDIRYGATKGAILGTPYASCFQGNI